MQDKHGRNNMPDADPMAGFPAVKVLDTPTHAHTRARTCVRARAHMRTCSHTPLRTSFRHCNSDSRSCGRCLCATRAGTPLGSRRPVVGVSCETIEHMRTALPSKFPLAHPLALEIDGPPAAPQHTSMRHDLSGDHLTPMIPSSMFWRPPVPPSQLGCPATRSAPRRTPRVKLARPA